MAERNTPFKDGTLISLAVAASTKIEAGKIVAVNASGYAIEASDAASIVVMGIAQETADNSSGANAAINVIIKRGKAFKLKNGTTAVTIAALGANVVVQDDETVTTAAAATNDIVVGKCLGVESDGVWVYIA
jgi:hypothetical protein